PYQPGIDRSEGELALSSALARTWHVVEEPAHLCAREIRVQHQARALGEDFRYALASHARAVFGCPPALPDDGVMNRLPCLAVPDDGRLTLIGDSKGRDLIGL